MHQRRTCVPFRPRHRERGQRGGRGVSKAQKVFAKYISLGDDTPEGKTFREGVERMGPMFYIDQNGQKRTMHGDIPFGDPVRQDIEQTDSKSYEEPGPNGEEGARVYPYSHSSPPEPEPHQTYSYGTEPTRRGWIKPTATPRKRTFKEFQRDWESNVARSVIRRRNKGLF